MAEARKLAGFDIEEKLQAPSKKSLFEKQKADAEAKRLREAEETAAVYQDFLKSFEEEEDEEGGAAPTNVGAFGDNGIRGGTSGPPKRHFPPANPPSGSADGRGNSRGFRSGGSGIGSLGPPNDNFSRKRTYDSLPPSRRDNDRGLLAFEDYENTITPKEAFRISDDEDEKTHTARAAERAIAKPTLQLASLPPGTSPAAIKALLPPNLTVDAVRMLSSNQNNPNTERKSISAIVTLAKDTAGNDIEAAVNSLQNRYLGFGFYLSLHRHLSSAAISSVTSGVNLSASSMPFGAKAVNLPTDGPQRHGPPGQRSFAPPTSYGPASTNLPRNGPLLHVPVQPPQDIKELKLIHKTIENLLTHGPEFEALLMSRPNVQREEKWAWLWDPRSTGGVWYRWRLYEILTGIQTRRGQGKYLPLFEGGAAWKSPDSNLPFEYITRIDEIVSDSDYNSSEDEDSGDERGRRNHGAGPPIDIRDEGKAYLNPLEKAKLTHLLARLPTNTAKLRKGDVARITAFAISHAGQGADEVVSAIISNIEKPFAYSSANPDRKKEKDEDATPGATPGAGIGLGATIDPLTEEIDDTTTTEKEDTSSAKLIGLYIISDILSSSSTSGVRHAWRYRQLFETALQSRKTFEHLGRLEKQMGWGRLRAEKWKRSVGNLLALWEGWCVFPQASHDFFVGVFREPPRGREEEEMERERMENEEAKRGAKWRSVEDGDGLKNDNTSFDTTTTTTKPTASTKAERNINEMDEMDIDGEIMEEDENMDGEPMLEDDEDVDGEPMVEDDDYADVSRDGDGDPMAEDENQETSLNQEPSKPQPQPQQQPLSLKDRIAAATAAAHAKAASSAESNGGSGSVAGTGTGMGGSSRKRRPKAEDMFADSDEEV